MNPYVLRFVIANVVLTVVLAVIAEILKLKSAGGLAAGATIGASIFAASAFAKDHSREPSSAEAGAFAWRALLATWVVSAVLAAIFLMLLSSASEIRALFRFLTSGSMLALMAGAVLFVSAIYYLGIRWSFRWYARLSSKRG